MSTRASSRFARVEDDSATKQDIDAGTVNVDGQEIQGEQHAQTDTTSAIASTSQRFVLVSDHGQTFLVPTSRASKYSSLPVSGQENESGNSTPLLRKRKLVRVPVKRGRGRPPKHGYKKFEFVEEEEDDDDDEYVEEYDGSAAPEDGEGGEEMAEEVETLPVAMDLNVLIADKEYVLENDHVRLPEDELGNGKVDSNGKLLGGREYRMPLFRSPQRPDPEIWYALSLDTARAIDYRDTNAFYRRNPLLIKLSCTDAEKAYLVDIGRLPAHLRARNVTMLAVKNVFKLFGHRIVLNGQPTTDDYYEHNVPEEGKLPADTPAPDVQQQTTVAPVATRTSERKQKEIERERYKRRADAFTYASTDLHGNPWFTTFGDAGDAPFERAKAWTARRANAMRVELNEDNWMLEMARSVRGMNKELLAGRQERLRAFGRPYEHVEAFEERGEADVTMAIDGETDSKVTMSAEEGKGRTLASADLPIGIYEPLTNVPHYPVTLQSQRATIERVYERPVLGKAGVPDTASSAAAKRNLAVLGRNRVGPDAWGIASIEQRVELPHKRIARNVRIPKSDALRQMDY